MTATPPPVPSGAPTGAAPAAPAAPDALAAAAGRGLDTAGNAPTADARGAPGAPEAPEDAAAGATDPDGLPLRFDADGRGWAAGCAVGVLAVAATLGLALPWALTRWRRHRQAHTTVVGRAFAYDGGNAATVARGAAAPVLAGAVVVAAETAPAAVATAVLLLALALLPWLRHGAARDEVARTRWDGEPLRCAASRSAFYALALRGLALAVLLALLLAAALVGVGAALGWQAGQADASRAALAPWLVAALALAAWLGVLRPLQRAARWNLTWHGAGHDRLRLSAALRGATLVRLAWRHALLLTLTLGLYAPWAAVAAARSRVQALRARVAAPGGGGVDRPAGATAGTPPTADADQPPPLGPTPAATGGAAARHMPPVAPSRAPTRPLL